MKRRTTALVMAGVTAAAVITGAAVSNAAGGPPAAAHHAGVPSAAAAAATVSLRLKPSSPELAACFPDARSRVTVALTTDAIGKDTFWIKASGLKRRTDYTVFLIQKAATPFGAVEYIGDIRTNRYGHARNRFKLIVEEAFAFNNETLVRKELNSVGFWFADPKDDNGCLGAGSPVTQFDGDASAGVQMMNSGLRKLP